MTVGLLAILIVAGLLLIFFGGGSLLYFVKEFDDSFVVCGIFALAFTLAIGGLLGVLTLFVWSAIANWNVVIASGRL